jgi:hypothetical protein
MNNEKTNTTTTAKADPPCFVKRIGNTTFKVNVHFSQTSKETMSDKIIRLLRNEVQNQKNVTFL